ncbi:MAG: hypothetical protein KY455_04310 [Euryarchaeota archaeon]|nr:hypothetical protein [Euryarchaeota archaeon]
MSRWSVPRTLLLVVALTAVAVSGCISDEPVTGEAPPVAPVVLEDALAALRAGNASANFERLGAFKDGTAQEIDAWGDYLAVMQNPKLRILDISDPTNVTLLSELTLTGVKDVKWSDDGQYIFVGDDGGLAAPKTIHVDGTAGIYVIDASDKSDPKVKSHLPIGPRRGPHMVFYHQTTDGRELVMGANADVSISEFDRKTGTLKELARYSPDVVFDWNRDPHVFDLYYQGFAHDMFVMEDPVENRTLMYVANWDAGLRIVDLSDPSKPKEVGKWMDYPESHSGNLHTVSTLWLDDRRITVGSPELGFAVVGGTHYVQGDELTGVYVWDTTDAANIELLSYWSHPDDVCKYAGRDQEAFGEELTSSHNLQFEAGRVYLAHYACGVLVLDLADPKAPALIAFDDDGLDDVWDVIVHKGVSYYGDVSGVFSTRFALDVLGVDGLSSRA